MKKVLVLLVAGLLATSVFAHEGHKGHGSGNPYKDFDIPIEQKDAETFAKSVIDRLVEKKKISESWRNAGFLGATQKVFKDQPEWVVSYKNVSIKEESKQVLYVFLSTYGEFLGINYTGE
ncbi:MAG: DUF6488 family protein [Gammaproteobacteria bacterium]|nr:DUF6488 family protein [Gammaproteobacteria bacterium]